jgi:peroxiredoxin Q/BCP
MASAERLFDGIALAFVGAVTAVLASFAAPMDVTPAATSDMTEKQRLDIRIGDTAPSISLPMYPRGTFNLDDHQGKTVVLYFYPGDGTPVCTQQAQLFRDRLAEFKRAGAEIYGVSPDSLDSHAAFAKQYSLPFPLLADTDGSARLAFGMPDGSSEIQGRMTYVIDKDGVVRAIIDETEDMDAHVDAVLTAVQSLAGNGRSVASAQ